MSWSQVSFVICFYIIVTIVVTLPFTSSQHSLQVHNVLLIWWLAWKMGISCTIYVLKNTHGNDSYMQKKQNLRRCNYLSMSKTYIWLLIPVKETHGHNSHMIVTESQIIDNSIAYRRDSKLRIAMAFHPNYPNLTDYLTRSHAKIKW